MSSSLFDPPTQSVESDASVSKLVLVEGGAQSAPLPEVEVRPRLHARKAAIVARGLGKAYTISHNAHVPTTMGEALMYRLKHPFQRAQRETFWAIQDMSFEIAQGEVVGVIGRNGAGKSTLLKILSRITAPTRGEVDLYGRVGSLLEVGTGFHPELTGRENIFLNGAILGMSRREIARQFDAIVEFAGVETFLDTPVKRYSSGMYVRLAFAVAAHLNSEILVVDEVLAVGDMEFQKKCLGKMNDVASSGRTVLFVSHSMQAVSTLCTRAIYLENGRVGFVGGVSEAIDRYMNTRQDTSAAIARRGGTGEMRCTEFATDKNVYLSEETITFDLELTAFGAKQTSHFVSIQLFNRFGTLVMHIDTRLLNCEFAPQERRKLRFTLHEPRLVMGDYRVDAFVCSPNNILDRFEGAATITIAPILPYPSSRNDLGATAIVYPRFDVEEIA